ncbi:MAG TPA: hypothetical protein ENN21_07540 [Spirochaetes bacterium]|nr:hypothetical protein [Spirochaetota bacterium]
MTFTRGNLGFFIAFLLLGGVLGSALGTLLVKLFPSLAIIHTNLTGPVSFNLEIISFGLRLNLSAIVGMVAGLLIFRKV